MTDLEALQTIRKLIARGFSTYCMNSLGHACKHDDPDAVSWSMVEAIWCLNSTEDYKEPHYIKLLYRAVRAHGMRLFAEIKSQEQALAIIDSAIEMAQ